jgi:alkaline phosphatase D
MKLNPLTIGPIVGHTSTKLARIWGRGDADISKGNPRRCFGALRYRAAGSGNWSRPMLCKMNPNFDMTGLFVITRLQPDTEYEFQSAYFFSDAEMDDAGFGQADWEPTSSGYFRTASADDNEPRSLIIGSCRYLLKTFLGSFFDNRGDKTFASILKQIRRSRNSRPVHQLIMMGDQIYADDLNAVNPDKNVGQFFARYRDAFSQPNIRELMANVPTYMTLDDHEIEDNWPSKATNKDWMTLYPVAMHAYLTYQASHGPLLPVKRGRVEGIPSKLWYTYTDGCTDVFVTDSRTERHLEIKSPEMLGPDQMKALKRWLTNGSERVKIVVSSVPFFATKSEDKWAGFPEQRAELLSLIDSKRVPKVVFFAGDVHASFSGELNTPTGQKIIMVVSSAFFWPYPHPHRFDTKSDITVGDAVYRPGNFSKILSDDNFTRVTATPNDLTVEVFGRKGDARGKKTHQF